MSSRTDLRDWPQTNGIDNITKATTADTAVSKTVLPSPRSVHAAIPSEVKQLRDSENIQSQADTASAKAERSPIVPVPLSTGLSMQEKNPWQQATGKKGHKKKNSIAYAAAAATANIQRSPVIESERKGG